MKYPAICDENFYPNPLEITHWAMNLHMEPCPQGNWPGVRSLSTDLLDEQFHHWFCNRVFSYFYDLEKVQVEADVKSYFQIIQPYSETSEYKNRGWIHTDGGPLGGKDGCQYAGIIYLSPDPDPSAGTSIYRQSSESLHLDISEKNRLYLGEDISDEEYDNAMKRHLSQFTEVTRYYNVYNRLIGFDSTQYHAATGFNPGGTGPRLTQVFFMSNIKVLDSTT